MRNKLFIAIIFLGCFCLNSNAQVQPTVPNNNPTINPANPNPIYTPTITPITPTQTITPTPTVNPTPTINPTPTVSPTPTINPTNPTPTINPTPTTVPSPNNGL